MLKSTIDMLKDLTIVSSGVMLIGFLTRPYRGVRRAIGEAASVYFGTLIGGAILKSYFLDEGTAYATAAVMGYFAPYIIDLITTLFVALTGDIKKCDFSKIIQNRLGGKDE